MPTHSLWLVPDRSGPDFARLRGLIETLARRFDTPVFDPHVTLLGGLQQPLAEVGATAERFAAEVEPREIRLGDIVSNGIYFQRLIALVSPTMPVMSAHVRAKGAFAADAADYVPHLSLAYGDLGAGQTAELQTAASAAGVAGTTFAGRSLELWRTDGPVVGWERVGLFMLGARGR